MTIKLFVGAACAALIAVAHPANAAGSGSFSTSPRLNAQSFSPLAVQAPGNALDAFYQARGGKLLWLDAGSDRAAAQQLLDVLHRAGLDGMADGPAIADQAQGLIERGDAVSINRADRMLAGAWIAYVQMLKAPTRGMTYADSSAAPPQSSPSEILAAAAGAPSLSAHVAQVSAVNPLYAELRAAAWKELQASNRDPDPRALASLDRVRAAPSRHRYLIVDTASATLWMIDDGRIADSMKVIVGKPSAQTPMVASTIYYATLNPYWNVPADLLRNLIGPRIVKQGVRYVTDHNYDVLSGTDGSTLDPANVDWQGVVDGEASVRLRQRPNPANSMGNMKFGFPNASDIFLHDSPEKDLFDKDSRNLSNGCIRLSDAPRLARWLMGSGAQPMSADVPEQHVALPAPVPIYITYLTAQVRDGQLAFVDDVYGRDSTNGSPMLAGLR